jgi:hypothetical protein
MAQRWSSRLREPHRVAYHPFEQEREIGWSGCRSHLKGPCAATVRRGAPDTLVWDRIVAPLVEQFYDSRREAGREGGQEMHTVRMTARGW